MSIRAASLLPIFSEAKTMRARRRSIAAHLLVLGMLSTTAGGAFAAEDAGAQPSASASSATAPDSESASDFGGGLHRIEAASSDFAIDKRMLSMRDMRYRHLVRQQFDYSCGAAAVATVLRHVYGRDIDEAGAILAMLRSADPEVVRRQGFSLLDMKQYVESQGFRGAGFKVQASRLYDLKVPVITLIDRDGFRHFVVVKRAAEGRVYLADPILGHRSMHMEAFERMFTGVILAVVGPDVDVQSPFMQTANAPALALRESAVMNQARHMAIDFGLRAIDHF